MHENEVNAYIPDNQFRNRDPLFADRDHKKSKSKTQKTNVLFKAEEFHFDALTRSCLCPAGESMWLKNAGKDANNNERLFFMGRLSKCRSCSLAS